MHEYLRLALQGLRKHGMERVTHDTMGWKDDNEKFLIGNQLIGYSNEETVMCGAVMKSKGLELDFGCNGDVETWAKHVDFIYNRPGVEAYQFAFLVAASAPITALLNLPTYRGIPFALTSKAGLGKSSVCRVACSMWGDPNLFKTVGTKDGATANALIRTMGIFNNVPLYFDELTGRDPDEIGRIMYALSSGMDKERLKADGTFSQGGKWNTPVLMNGNDEFSDLLSKLSKAQAEATQLRVFEVRLPENYGNDVWGDDLGEIRRVLDKELSQQYGHVGRKLIKLYIKNKDKLVDHYHKERDSFPVGSREDSKERFFLDLIAIAMVAGKVMVNKGVVGFDLIKIKKWALMTLMELRQQRVEKVESEEDIVARFISFLHGKTIVSKRIPHGKGARNNEFVENADRLREHFARHAIEDKKFIVASRAISVFAGENNMSSDAMLKIMENKGYILHIPGRTGRGRWQYRLGGGTNVVTAPTSCYELDYTLLCDAGFEIDTNNVTALHPAVANSVAGGVTSVIGGAHA